MREQGSVPLRPRDPLSGEHGGAREKPLTSRDGVLVVVQELEIPFSQLEHATSAGAPTLSVPRSLNTGKMRDGIHGRARDRFTDRHAVAEQLRHAVGKVDRPRSYGYWHSSRWKTYRARSQPS